MRSIRSIVSALVVMSLVAGIVHIASARTFNHPSGFSFSFPDAWKVEKGNNTITGSASSDAAAVSFSIPPKGASLELIESEYQKAITKTLSNVKTGKTSKGVINGLKVVFVDGAGSLSGTPVNFTVGVYSNGKRYLGVFALARKSAYKAQENALVKILKSVHG
jgi:hypothetical protein